MPQRLRLPEQNNVTLAGRTTRDPDMRYTPKGDAICRFDLAIGRSYRDAAGTWQKETDFIPVVVWREAAVRCGERLKKGYPVLVTGSLRSRSWEDKEGKKHSAIEVNAQRVQFLWVAENEEKAPGKTGDGEAPVSAGPVETADEEEIPF